MTAERPYFDAAFIFRLYSNEPGANQIRRFAGESDGLTCAVHAQAEIISAAHRKYREGSASKEGMDAIVDQFETDCADGGILLLPLTSPVFERLKSVWLAAPREIFLRAADALHLACAADAGCAKIYSNDRHLLAAAPLFDLEGIDLIA